MAQNDPRGMEAAPQSGTTGSRTGTESSGTYAGTKSPPSQATEQGRTESTTEGGTTTGREQGQTGRRLSRREGLDDQVSTFFGGSPFALFRRLSDDMDRLFFGGGQGLGSFGAFGVRFMPNVDVEEREDRILIRADLPGVRPDDFRVDIEDDAVVLQGERRTEREESRSGIRRSERSYGSFRRVIPLPQGANADEAEARFENGVLEIEIPLQQASHSRRLDVRTGAGASTTRGTGTPGTSSGTGSEGTKH